MISTLVDKIMIQREVFPTICVALLTIILLIFFLKKVKNKYPPGPYGLPIIGYLPYLTYRPYLKFIELTKKYGDIFSINLGPQPLIILNNADRIREVFLKPEFLGRPPNGPLFMFKAQSPFLSCPIPVWQEQRRFIVHTMKDLGLGKSKIEEHIRDEILSFLEALKSHNTNPMDPDKPLSSSVSNNILALVFGFRFPLDHPIRKMLDENSRHISKFIQQTAVLSFFPWLRYLPFYSNTDYKNAKTAYDESIAFFKEEVRKHEETFDPQNIRDYVDSYIIQMRVMKEKDPNTSFNEQTLIDSATDLFGVGGDTARTSILWLIYIAAAYPDVQKKVRKEIFEVIGNERMASFLDQKLMPYTHGVILEMLRWITIVPLNILHATVADTDVGGYDIPKDTTVMANFWWVHHDPKNWSNPDKFQPERFIGKDGKSIVKPINFMPFSVGKRACLGETMAFMEIFLYFVSILQKFEIVFPAGYTPTFESVMAITLKPKDFTVRFISLDNN